MIMSKYQSSKITGESEGRGLLLSKSEEVELRSQILGCVLDLKPVRGLETGFEDKPRRVSGIRLLPDFERKTSTEEDTEDLGESSFSFTVATGNVVIRGERRKTMTPVWLIVRDQETLSGKISRSIRWEKLEENDPLLR